MSVQHLTENTFSMVQGLRLEHENGTESVPCPRDGLHRSSSIANRASEGSRGAVSHRRSDRTYRRGDREILYQLLHEAVGNQTGATEVSSKN